jgi:hypothetical protein
MSERTGGGFLSRLGGVLAVLAIMGIGVAVLGYGGYMLWVGHSGTPAQVTLLKCHSPVGSKLSECSAAWLQADGTKRTVTVYQIPNDEAYAWPRKTVDVHVRGDLAYMNSSSSSALYMILFGIAVSGFGVWLFLPSRRKKHNQRSQVSPPDDPGTPQAQIT